MTSGIYKITNRLNGRSYVGSAINVVRRFVHHRNRLRAGAHHSPALQSAWNSHGEGVFDFEIIEVVAAENLVACEQAWIDKLSAYGRGYNGRPIAASLLGFKHSDAARAKMSRARTGKPSPRRGVTLSPETIAKIQAAKVDWRPSAETVARVAAKNRGQKRSPEVRARMSAAAHRRFGTTP